MMDGRSFRLERRMCGKSSLETTRRDLIRPAGGSSMDQFEATITQTLP